MLARAFSEIEPILHDKQLYLAISVQKDRLFAGLKRASARARFTYNSRLTKTNFHDKTRTKTINTNEIGENKIEKNGFTKEIRQ